jgi:hypothetical protein
MDGWPEMRVSLTPVYVHHVTKLLYEVVAITVGGLLFAAVRVY